MTSCSNFHCRARLLLDSCPKVTVDMIEVLPDKAALGKAFKKEAKLVTDHLSGLDKAAIESFEQKLAEAG